MLCQVGCGVRSGSDSAHLDSGTLGTMEPTTHTWILRVRHVCDGRSEQLCTTFSVLVCVMMKPPRPLVFFLTHNFLMQSSSQPG